MQSFGVYGFNKSHAYAYGMLGYWTAYVKKHYPREFMTALFQTNPAQSVAYIRESRRMGIPVLGPDINESSSGYTLTQNGAIRYGLNSIKFVGGSADHIKKLGPFSSMEDFVSRVPKKNVNKRAMMALIKCGVFDSIVNPTNGRTYAEQAAYEYWKCRGDWKKIDDNCTNECDYCSGKLSVFDCYCEKEQINDRALAEREYLGTLVSLDPLGEYVDLISSEENFPGEKKMYAGEKATLGGLIAKVNELVVKKGKKTGHKMCQLWIELPNNFADEDDDFEDYNEEDNYGGDNMIQLVCFPDVYAKYKNNIKVGSPILVNVEKLDDGLQLKNLFRLDLLKAEVA